MQVRTVDARELIARLAEFATLTVAVVQAGGSLGWEYSFSLPDAAAYWRDEVGPFLDPNERVLFGAFENDVLVGTAQIERAHFPMSRHRAEVLKLIVHPKLQRRGIGKALMEACEVDARRIGIELFVLDTRAGIAAGTFYSALGYSETGYIPNWIKGRDGHYEATVYFFKLI